MTAVAEHVTAAIQGGNVTICEHITSPRQRIYAHMDSISALLCERCYQQAFDVRKVLSDGSCDVCRTRPATAPVALELNDQLVVVGQVCDECGGFKSEAVSADARETA